MLQVASSSWALLLGMFMLMVGNGMQGTLLGVRGEIEGFGTLSMSVIMSAYFLGFLAGSRMAPEMIRRVGHVRVFAALGSGVSAALILYPAVTEPWAWIGLRVLIGLCFSGVYVTAESWLNNAATNETRGKALSIYMIVQMGGIVVAQYLLLVADASGFILFVIPSVLVSFSFAPILLSVSPTPSFEMTKRMPVVELARTSPLVSIGMVLLGGVYAAQFGMAAVFGAREGLSTAQISVFISTIYTSAMLAQFPIGWLSDWLDRRLLIIGLSAIGALGAMAAFLMPMSFTMLLISAALLGGTCNPLYSLLIAYANDYLEREDMAAASSGFIFINGLGAILGPLMVGWMMDLIGPHGFWAYIAVMMLALAGYGAYRSSRRPAPSSAGDYVPVTAAATGVAVDMAQEYYIEAEEDEETEG